MTFRFSLLLFGLGLLTFRSQYLAAQDTINEDLIVAPAISVNYGGFLNLSSELQSYRQERLVEINEFASMLVEDGVLLLDTRSAAAYRAIHIKGAIHINFSDFTEEKLASIIPDKETKILIYCNNNFTHTAPSLANKAAPLALNIPTFINLYGYGYENIYELKGEYTSEQAEQYLEFEQSTLPSLLNVAPDKKE